MTKKRDRFFALFGAILFLVTASALTVAVIWSAVTNKSGTTTPSTTSAKTSATTLQGTKLANFTPVITVPSLLSTDTVAGTGAAVKSGDSLTVDYTGALANDGTIFQSSKDSGQKFTFVVGKGNVIPGWDQGLIGMKVGSTRRLLIPASLAYGAQAQTGIPANSDLVFDVTLYKIGN